MAPVHDETREQVDIKTTKTTKLTKYVCFLEKKLISNNENHLVLIEIFEEVCVHLYSNVNTFQPINFQKISQIYKNQNEIFRRKKLNFARERSRSR